MGNETQFHILVADRASVWKALAAIFRSELIDPRGVMMEDITDLIDIVRFCRAHGAAIEVPVQSTGRCSLEALASLFERTASICARDSDADLFVDLATVQDFSMVFSYRSKDTLTAAMVKTLRPIAASVFARRYVSRGAIDPSDDGVAYSCELELIDPFDLKGVDAKLVKLVKEHLENPDAYVGNRKRVEAYIQTHPGREPKLHSHITVTFDAGFISQYAIHTMQLLAAALPEAAIFGGTPDDAALPASIPLCENDLHSYHFLAKDGASSAQRALDFLDMLLFGGLFGDPDAPQEDIESGVGVTVCLANSGRELLPLKDRLAPGSEIAQLIDEAALNRGELQGRSYRALARALVLGGLDVPRLAIATSAAILVRDPGSTSVSGATLVRALQAYNDFRAQVYHDFPEERESLAEIFDNAAGKPAHISLDRDATTGEVCLLVDVHWSYNGYYTTALDQHARNAKFHISPRQEPNSYVIS